MYNKYIYIYVLLFILEKLAKLVSFRLQASIFQTLNNLSTDFADSYRNSPGVPFSPTYLIFDRDIEEELDFLYRFVRNNTT